MIRRLIKISFVLLTILSAVSVCFSGCAGETIDTDTRYKTYEMKEGDVRLEYLQHPLFAFEYPEFFNLIDLNPIPGDYVAGGPLTGGPPMDYGQSIVDFTFKQEGLPRGSLSVIIVTQDYVDMFDTSNLFEIYLSEHALLTEEITIKEMSVYGISADYMEAFRTEEKIKPLGIVEEYRTSSRIVVFDHAGLIWSIIMHWHYFEPESPEIEEYFNHVIETFEIIE